MDTEVYLRMAMLEEKHWWFEGRRIIIETLLKHLDFPANGKILEVGSGTGGNFLMLSKFGKVDAIEPDASARALVSNRCGVELTEGSLPDQIPFPPHSFDLIVALDVLEHIKDDQESLVSIKRFLKPDGHLLLTVPAYQFLWSEHDEQHHHERRYCLAELTGLLEKVGYTIHRKSYFNTLLLPLILLMRFTKRLLNRKTPDDKMPAGPINKLLLGVLKLENYLLRKGIYFPVGVSILVLAQNSGLESSE